jgi:hypothetical protein
MDARYSRAELCLIHLATVLATRGWQGEAIDLVRDEARAVLRAIDAPSPDLVWLVRCLRDGLADPTGPALWRLQMAVADLSTRRAAALFDPMWRAAHV